MAKLIRDLHKYVELREEDYLKLIENSLLVEALKIAGIEKLPLYQAARHILDDKRVEIHIKPVSRRYGD